MADQPVVPNTAPKKFIFVLMPFDQSFEDVYQVGIKAACRDAGAYCERVDEQIFHESILERVYNQIAKADLIVADMTGRNPNVFYEVGYAHALNKKSILLTRDADDIPFDLKHYPHIVYGGRISQLKTELERRVAWYLAQPESETSDVFSKLDYFIDGQKVTDGASIDLISIPIEEGRYIAFKGEMIQPQAFSFALYNRSDTFAHSEKMCLMMIHPESWQYQIDFVGEGAKSTLSPDGEHISWVDLLYQPLPSAWERFECFALINSSVHNIDVPLKIKIITAFGNKQIDIFLHFLRKW